MICPNCRYENKEGAKFCNECGFPLTGRMAAVAAASSGDAPARAEEAGEDLERSPIGAAGGGADAEGHADGPDAEGGPEGHADGPDAEGGPEASGPLDRASIPAIDVAGVNVDENGNAFDFSSIGDDEAARAADDLTPFVPRRPDERPVSGRGDFSGFDECLVDAGYVPPQNAWGQGDTMEMPRIEGQARAQKEFRAPDPNQKKGGKGKDGGARADKRKDKEEKKKEKKEKEKEKGASEHAGTSGHEDKDKDKNKNKDKVVAIVLICLLVVGGAAAGVTYYLELWGGKMLPDVVSMTQSDAAYVLQSKGFAVREEKVKSDETEGVVLAQDPAAGAREKAGSEVVIHVSEARTIPEAVGKQRDEVAARLEKDGFANVTYVDQKSDGQEGLVLAVAPEAGSKATADTAITVTVAVPFTVPDVTGKTWDEASKLLKDAGYAPVANYAYDESVAPGTVLSTDPAAGEKAASGSTVSASVAMSRASELQQAAQSYLGSGQTINIGGTSYLVDSVDSVKYEGNETTSFTITCRAVTTLDGETVYGSSKQKSGSIVWTSSNTIASIS